MQLSFPEILVLNLTGIYDEEAEHFASHLYIGKERAYDILKKITDQDFGYDVELWRIWFKEAGITIRSPKIPPKVKLVRITPPRRANHA